MDGSAPRHRIAGAFAALVLATAGSIGLIATTVTPAAATTATASTQAELNTALADSAVTHIDITGNITTGGMACGNPSGSTFRRANVGGDLVIDGHGFSIDGSGCVGNRVLELDNSGGQKITLLDIKITGGNLDGVSCDRNGAGVLSSSGALVLDHSEIKNNTVAKTSGGNICGAAAAGVNAGGPLTLLSSTVSNNALTCTSCTSGQTTGAAGIEDYGSSVLITLVSSTVTNNTVTNTGTASHAQGGGIVIGSGNSLSLVYSTVVDNTAAEGANILGSTFTSFGSVVALPQGGGNSCAVTSSATSNGYNFEDATSCGFGGGTGDITNGGDPLLNALANNGGPTDTRAPQASSALLDKIPNGSCQSGGATNIVSDQRDFVRPYSNGSMCDIGAVERHPSGVSGKFSSVTPARILDTRNGTGGLSMFGPTHQTQDLTVLNAGGIPSSGVEAVVLNVTATGSNGAGWLTLFPAGTSVPTAANLNFVAGQSVPNLVVVKVGAGGKVSIGDSNGAASVPSLHVIADVVGYYRDATVAGTSELAGLTPVRKLDTRNGTGGLSMFGPAHQMQSLTVTGGSVPGTAEAVVLNVAVTGGTGAGWLTLFPAGGSTPNAANLNFSAGQTVANLVVVKVGTAGQISISDSNGAASVPSVHVIADLVGYYDASVSTGAIVAAPPQRIVDTRTGTGGIVGPIAPQGTITFDPRRAVQLPAPGDYTGVVANVTVTGATAAGWLTVYPSDATLPTAANLNFTAGSTVPNLVMVKVGADGTIKITNTGGATGGPSVHIIVDILGWYR